MSASSLSDLDPEQRVDDAVRADGLPHPGDPDYPEYATLFNEASTAMRPVSEGQDLMLFSRRKRIVDELWRLGYRKPKQP